MRTGGFAAVLSTALCVWAGVLAATKTVDLDGRTGAESAVDLNILQTFPPRIENKVTNRTPGDAFQFSWKSAGPGGFTSSTSAGTAGGVGVTWVWTTNQTVYAFTGNSCANDVCFIQTGGPDPLGSVCELGCFDDGVRLTVARGATPDQVQLSWNGGSAPYGVYRAGSAGAIAAPTSLVLSTAGAQYTDTPPAGGIVFYRVQGAACLERKACQSNADCIPATEGACVSRGPFAVPGRSLFASDVTVSSSALTSSLITFFSPPHEVFRATSSVAPSPSGVAVQETLANLSTAPMTVRVDPFPPGCCPEPGRINCGGDCYDWRTDNGHCGGCDIACGEGAYCSEGSCVSICPEGETFCGEGCVDTDADPQNCGGCGQACAEGEVCSEGECTPYCPEGTTSCGDACVSTQSDEQNCGGCGRACAENEICVEGGCAPCPEGTTACGGTCVETDFDDANCGACGNDCSVGCEGDGYCYYGECFCGSGDFGEGGGEGPPEAPLCQVAPSETTIPPGGTAARCTAVQGFLVKEVATSVRVCGDGVPGGEARCPDGSPATQGTFMKLVPDFSKPIGDAFLTPFAVHVDDPSHDGLIQPGETVGLSIEVLNAGPATLRDLHVQLKSPPVDLTDDGVLNPISVDIPAALSAYGDVLGTPAGAADCGELPPPHPATNASKFWVTLGDEHPGDVSRPFVLSATGRVNGAPFAMDMPLALGIADICDPTAPNGDYDGLDGLLAPLARLVPEGEPLVYPDKIFNRGQTIPAKFRILCDGVSLRSGEIEDPVIVGLSLLGGRAVTLGALPLNADGPDPYDLTFGFDAAYQQWNFDLRTDALDPGTYVLKIRIGGRKTYEAVFVLR